MDRRRLALVTLACVALTGCGADEVRPPDAVPGTYVLQKDVMKEEWIDAAESGVDAAAVSAPARDGARVSPGKAGRIERMLFMLRELSLVKTLREDGTWSAVGMLAGRPMEAEGTWKLEGETITFRQTRVDGKASDEVRSASYVDGAIRLKPDADWPVELVLRKR